MSEDDPEGVRSGSEDRTLEPDEGTPVRGVAPPGDVRLGQTGGEHSAPHGEGEPPRAPAARKVAEDGVAPVWKVGDVIADLYEVTDVLGAGGMGEVHKVRHKGWNVDLAVKSPKPEELARAGGAENFERECETWVNLGLHPHIVSCYYVRTLGGVPRVFAEYVEGGSLADWIHSKQLYEGGPDQALRRIVDIGIQFAWGMRYAHERGLVHHDVKPANVMMSPEGLAKVTDFGLAKARGRVVEQAGAACESVLVASGGMTPAYCSPEQANRQPLSRKTDIWSWGVSVLEMFTGEVIWMAGQAAPEALRSYLDTGTGDAALPPMPEAIAELLEHCFAEDPKDRPQTMQEVARPLMEVYQNLTNESYPRKERKAAELSADSLNNRALSFLDLEKRDQAEAAWQAALTVDPQHPETTYNRGLALWRNGKLTDEALVEQLEAVRRTHGDSWRAKYLLSLVHLERGDVDTALPLLEAAERQAPGEWEVQEAIRLAKSDSIVPGKCLRTFEGHDGAVYSVCLSADARLALSGGLDLRVWEVATGRCLRTFEGYTTPLSVCLSADARLALSGSADKTLRLWEVATGRCLRTFEGHTSPVLSVCLSVDARLALSGSGEELWNTPDNTLRLWDVATGKCLRTFDGHTRSVNSVCLSTDSRFALSGSFDATLRLWEIATGRCLRTFENDRLGFSSVCLSADARLALSGSWDNTLRLWDVATGRCLRTFVGHAEQVYAVCLSVDAGLALSGSRDNTLRLWDIATGRCLRTFEGHTDSVKSVCLSADSRFALSGSGELDGEDNTLRWWQLPSGRGASPQLARVWSFGEASEVDAREQELVSLAEAALEGGQFSAALYHLREARALPGRERALRILEAWGRLALSSRQAGLRSTWLVRPLEGHNYEVGSVCLSADARLALSGSVDKTLRLWEVATGRCLRTFAEHTESVHSVCLSADASLALSGSANGNLRLWEVATGRCLRTFERYSSEVRSICLSTDARWALVGFFDNTMQLREVATGRCLRTFEGHKGPVFSVCLSADARLALSGSMDDIQRRWDVATHRDGLASVVSMDDTLRLWDVATGRCLQTFEGNTTVVGSVCLSADARLALSGSWDNTLRLWDVATGRCLRTFEGHTGPVTSVCLSADARLAVSGSTDGTLQLWEVATGRCLRTFAGHRGTVTSVCLSADARLALSGSWDNTLRLWYLDWDLEACDPADWDDGARPHLETFLSCHTPYAGTLAQNREPTEEEVRRALTRRGTPSWTEDDFQRLLHTLGCVGYGWLRPEGVRRELEAMRQRPATFETMPPADSSVMAQHAGAVKLDWTGRNQPCPCGSGRRYKNCCGKLT